MQSAKFAALFALPALLAGCGGSSSDGGGNSTPPSPPPPAKYTVNFLTMSKINASDAGNCAIYGQDREVSPQTYVVVDKNKATARGMFISIHDENGKTTAKYDSTNWNNGSFSFNQNEVKENGYISIVNITRGGVYDILTIQKPLIPQSFSVNSLNDVASDPAATCVTKSNSNLRDYTGFINPHVADDGNFAFRSSIESQYSLSPLPLGIDFKANIDFEVLAARYCRDASANPTSCNPNELLEYKITNVRNLGSASTPLELGILHQRATWTPDTSGDTTLDSAQLKVNHGELNSIPWQDLPINSSFNFSYADELLNSYVLNVDGSHKGWAFNYTSKQSNLSSGIDESSTLSDLNVPVVTDIATALQSGCTSSEVNYCLNGYGTSMAGTFNYQRTAVMMDQKVHQSIYGTAKHEQPLMHFDDVNIDNIWSGTLKKSEIALIQSNDSNTVEGYFISSFNQPFQIFDNGYLNTSGIDTVFIVHHPSNLKDEEVKLEHLPHVLLVQNQSQ